MARTGATQDGIDATMRSPSPAGAVEAYYGSATTALTMQSVADRTSGRVAALLCCGDKAPVESFSGPVATTTANAVPKSGARIMGYPLPFSAQIAGTSAGGQPDRLPVPGGAVL